MTLCRRFFVDTRSTNLALLAAASLCLSGCGAVPTGAPVAYAIPAISGVAHGGPNPIKNGNVILWETQSNNYGGTGKQLASTTTDGYGSFNFAPGGTQDVYTCDSGQYAYITVTGGNTGAPTANANSVQLAAIGACSALSTSTKIVVSEMSTAAAAYSLGAFITIDPNTGAGSGMQLVNISAPANNNTASPSCTGSGSTMACTANGLGHGFANAANLVYAVSSSGTPTGLAYSVPPSNSDATAPASMLGLLGNILQSCVQSTGGTAGDGSPCGKLFTDATPPVTSPVAPTDTLSAVLDISHYPTHNVSALTALATPISFFSPALTATNDFSLSIFYAGTHVGSTTTNFPFVYGLSLDAADDVYVITTDKSTPTYSGLAGLKSDGTSLFYSATSTTYKFPIQVATDTQGHAWVTNNAGAGTLIEYSTTDGSITSTYSGVSPFGVAIDRSNNVWFTSTKTGSGIQGLFELNSSSSYSNVTFANPPLQPTNAANGVAIDSNQNVWTAINTGSSAVGAGAVFPNTGNNTSPAYANAQLNTNLPGTDYNAYGIVIDGSNNAFIPGHQTLSEYTPVLTTGVITGTGTPSDVSTSTGTTPYFSAIDGAGTVWMSQYSTAGTVYFYSPTTSTAGSLKPCFAGAATTCITMSTNNRAVQVDSTGSVWVAAGGVAAGGGAEIIQIIGAGTPAWPQLSYGHPGTEPQ
jgi:streptogramin lyase